MCIDKLYLYIIKKVGNNKCLTTVQNLNIYNNFELLLKNFLITWYFYISKDLEDSNSQNININLIEVLPNTFSPWVVFKGNDLKNVKLKRRNERNPTSGVWKVIINQSMYQLYKYKTGEQF